MPLARSGGTSTVTVLRRKQILPEETLAPEGNTAVGRGQNRTST